ncbi:MAG: YraN family protein [Bellilinea sp.]
MKKISNNFKQQLGAWGERQAEAYLIDHGLELLERNFRTLYGEIDLVMLQEDQLVFVEVKTRSNDAFGLPEESVTERKKEHLLQSAQQYLEDHPDSQLDWRIDVVSIRKKAGNDPVEIVWFENALA